MEKSPETKEFIDNMAKEFFGVTRTEAILTGICVFCGKEAKEFKDSLSVREFKISGLCQKCQDEVFD